MMPIPWVILCWDCIDAGGHVPNEGSVPIMFQEYLLLHIVIDRHTNFYIIGRDMATAFIIARAAILIVKGLRHAPVVAQSSV